MTHAVPAAELTAFLAARMCHDFISPASAIVSGLDLLEDPANQDMREDAMGLIASSARKLADLLAFSRIAFGASAQAQAFDPRELETLVRGVFGHMRAELDWAVEAEQVNKAGARTLLNLAQLAGAALPTGGVARIRAALENGRVLISAEAQGDRARLRPEVLRGLQGETLEEGMHGHWVQAYYLHLVVSDAGGVLRVEPQPGRVTFGATLPA